MSQTLKQLLMAVGNSTEEYLCTLNRAATGESYNKDYYAIKEAMDMLVHDFQEEVNKPTSAVKLHPLALSMLADIFAEAVRNNTES